MTYRSLKTPIYDVRGKAWKREAGVRDPGQEGGPVTDKSKGKNFNLMLQGEDVNMALGAKGHPRANLGGHTLYLETQYGQEVLLEWGTDHFSLSKAGTTQTVRLPYFTEPS